MPNEMIGFKAVIKIKGPAAIFVWFVLRSSYRRQFASRLGSS